METIAVTCYKCAGAGTWTKNTPLGDEVHDPCPVCNGSGSVAVSYVNLDDYMDKLNDILDKCNDIFEKVSE